MMVMVTEIPLVGKMRSDFDSFFQTTQSVPNSWSGIEFNKAEILAMEHPGVSHPYNQCGVCGHSIIWGELFVGKGSFILGICCAVNLLAMQKYGGDVDKMNFDRIVSLEKKTMMKKLKEAQKEHEKIMFEAKYDSELKYAKTWLEMLQERGVNINGGGDLAKVHWVFFREFLYWLNQGVVKDWSLDLMRQHMIVSLDERMRIYEIDVAESVERNEKYYQEFVVYQNKVVDLGRVSLGKFDIDFHKSLMVWGRDKNFFTPKQRESIDKMYHKYRKQLGVQE